MRKAGEAEDVGANAREKEGRERMDWEFGVGRYKLLRMDQQQGPTVVQSCPTLWDPWTIALPGSSVHGILQARTLE